MVRRGKNLMPNTATPANKPATPHLGRSGVSVASVFWIEGVVPVPEQAIVLPTRVVGEFSVTVPLTVMVAL